jgi:DNA-binding NtrC family response regulator
MSHGTRGTVLLIEPDKSLRRLIALGLRSRDMHVIEASSPGRLPPDEEPDLLVLDIDGRASKAHSLLTAIHEYAPLSTLPIVLLAWDYPVPFAAANEQESRGLDRMTYLAKPFDARELHATIEQLLALRALEETEQAQAVLLPAQSAASSPSILPFVTAAGLLLLSFGLLGLFAFTALGLCIVIIALLWWTTGAKPERAPALPVSLSAGKS